MANSLTNRPSASELRKAAHELCQACGGRLKVTAGGGYSNKPEENYLPCLNVWHTHIDAIAARLEEAERPKDRNIREEMRGGSIGALIERAEKAERDCDENAADVLRLQTEISEERRIRREAERDVERLRSIMSEMKEHEDSRHDDCELCDRRDAAIRGDER